MLPTDLLSIEAGRAPYARVSERTREILMHEPRDVLHGLAPVDDERPAAVGRTARGLGVDAGDTEMTEEPGTDLVETLAGGRRHRQGGIAKPGHIQEGAQLGVRLGE